MATQTINNFNLLDFDALSTVGGGIQTGTWQGAALKGIGYGIKSGITYGVTCHF